MEETKKQKVVPLVRDTYMAVIKNSIGSNIFRNSYAKVNGIKTDIVRNGDLSCALYVSSILALFKLIKDVHSTVAGTEKDMKKSGWETVKEPKIGSVIVWMEKKDERGEAHRHIGFYIGDDMAISNSNTEGAPVEHHVTFNSQREIESVYFNPAVSD